MASGGRRSLRNNKLEMAKVSCQMRLPIVLLERLVIKTDKTVTCNRYNIDKVVLDNKQEFKVTEETFKKLKKKVVNFKQKCIKPQEVEPTNNLPSNANESSKIEPKVISEKVPKDKTATDSCIKENVTITDKPNDCNDNLNNEVNCVRTFRKTRRKNYEVVTIEKTESMKEIASSINKENLTSNTADRQQSTENVSCYKKNSISIKQENISDITMQPVQTKEKSKKSVKTESNEDVHNDINDAAQKQNKSTHNELDKNTERASEIIIGRRASDVDDEIIVDIMTVDDEEDVDKENDSQPNTTIVASSLISESPSEFDVDIVESCIDIKEMSLDIEDEEIRIVNKSIDISSAKTNDITNENNLSLANGNSKAIVNKSNFVNEMVDSSDILSENSSYESSTDDEDETDNGSEIGEFSPVHEIPYHSESSGNPDEIFTDTNIDDKNDQSGNSVNKHKYLFISLKDAYESISADMNSLDENVCTYEASYEGCDESVRFKEELPEVLLDSDYPVGLENDRLDIGNTHNAVNNPPQHPVSSTLEKRLNFIRKSQPLNSPEQYHKQNDQTHLTPSKGSLRKKISIRIARCPKCKKKFTDVNFVRHWDMCRIGPYIPCIFCDNKFMQKRSLISHLKKHHYDKIDESNISLTADMSYMKAKAALAKLKKLPTEMLEIHVPDFIRVYCKICFTMYNTLPSNYRKSCYDCSKVLTYHCNRCHSYALTSHLMAMHMRSECKVIKFPTKPCGDCEYVSVRATLQTEPTSMPPPTSPSPPRASSSLLLPSLPPRRRPPPVEEHVVCDRCDKVFPNRRAIGKHKVHCGQAANLMCKYCPFKTKHRSVIMTHMQQHVVNNDPPIVREDEVKIIENLSSQPSSEPQRNRSNIVTPLEKKQHDQIIQSMIGRICLTCGTKTDPSQEFLYSCHPCKTRVNFICMECQTISSSHCLMTHHVAREHAPKIFTCKTCDRKYSFELDYKRHTLQCKMFKCKKCSYKTKQELKFFYHQKRQHPGPKAASFWCPRCRTRFTVKSSLNKHMLSCGLVEPRFNCAHCNFKTNSKYSLKRHLQSQHAIELFSVQFSCEYCAKPFTNVFYYESHVKKCPLNFDV